MKIFKYIIGISILTAVSSCAKDLGNYDYQPINEIDITGIASSYSGLVSIDTIKINPTIAMTENVSDPDRFDYLWVVKQGTTVIDTVGREKDLKLPIKLAPNNYGLQLRIEDKTTKVTWTKKATLTVGTPYSKGLLIMGENEEGFADLDIISMVRDTIVVKNILKENGLPPLNGPLLAQHTGGSEAYIKMWVSTSSGAYYLDRATMEGSVSNTFGKLLYLTDQIDKEKEFPLIVAPQIINAAGGIGTNFVRAVLTSNGNVFASYLALNGGDYYANPINRVNNNMETLLKAAPYLLYPMGNMSSMMWYDTDNQRFMNYSTFILRTYSEIPKDTPDDIFPWDQAATGRTLVYAENTRNTDGGSTNGNSFAIMKDGSNQHFVYKFYANGANPSKRSMYTIQPIATDFDKADFYTFSSNRTVIFYSVGSKLYAYDYNPGNEKLYQFPSIGNDPITLLKFDTQIDHISNSLYVATYNATTKGTLRRFTVGNNPNIVEIQPVDNAKWDGLVKIKSMNWRAVN